MTTDDEFVLAADNLDDLPRVQRVLDDPEQEWLRQAHEGMKETALYPEAVRRRDERRRQGEEE